MTTTLDVLDAYLDGGDDYLNALSRWGHDAGWEVRRQKGVVTVRRDGRVVAAACPPIREKPSDVDPTIAEVA